MSTSPLLGPAPISIEGDTFDPEVNACFACTPLYEHPRKWVPDPNGPRARTLILCFDGTGDSFDKDVSQPSTPSYLGSLLKLNAVSAEFQRRTILGDVEERRSLAAARLLSGNFPQPTCGIPVLMFSYQAGIGTYTSNVFKNPIFESVSKLWDSMVAYDIGQHITGLSFLLTSHYLAIPEQSF
jgi:hypothetical protein